MKVLFNRKALCKYSSYPTTTSIVTINQALVQILSAVHVLFNPHNNTKKGYFHFVARKQVWSSLVSYPSQKPSPAWLQSFYHILISLHSQILTFYFIKPRHLRAYTTQTEIKLKPWEDGPVSSRQIYSKNGENGFDHRAYKWGKGHSHTQLFPTVTPGNHFSTTYLLLILLNSFDNLIFNK